MWQLIPVSKWFTTPIISGRTVGVYSTSPWVVHHHVVDLLKFTIPLSKQVITLVINGISRVNPLTTGVNCRREKIGAKIKWSQTEFQIGIFSDAEDASQKKQKQEHLPLIDSPVVDFPSGKFHVHLHKVVPPQLCQLLKAVAL